MSGVPLDAQRARADALLLLFFWWLGLQRSTHTQQACALTGGAREHLGHGKGLGEEALDLARARHGHLVLLRQLVHAQDSNDVLEKKRKRKGVSAGKEDGNGVLAEEEEGRKRMRGGE